MATANFNMRFDAETKRQFESVLVEYGLTAPQAFKLFANQVIKTKKIPLSFDFLNNCDDYNKTKMTEEEFYAMIDKALEEPAYPLTQEKRKEWFGNV